MPVELDDKTNKIFEDIKTLSFLQTANLVKAFEDEFGITASAPMAVVAAPAGGGAAGGEEEVTDVSVVLADAGGNKIAVLKEVRAITGLGLKEAKDLVDGAPKEIKGGVKKEEAAEIKAKLEAAGAKVELK
jgi:large subunit ribosomal protein L7/L12